MTFSISKSCWVVGVVALLAGCTSGADGEAPPTGATAGSVGVGGSASGGSGGAGAGGSVTTTADVGVVPAGRLNRTHYNNSVRDLLGTSLRPADGFPADELVLGFDVIAGVLRVQPEHVEKYLAAADELVAELLQRPATDPVRQRYFTCDVASGAACVGTVTKNLAQAAWRRPVSDAELAPYVAAAMAQTTAEAGISVALRAVLTSSKFLFRWELDPNPEDATPHLVSGYEMATRLSYALWGTTPDAELLAAAGDGSLQTPEGVLAQARRMLGSGAGIGPLIETFAAQWLNVNQVATVTPDPTLFPMFDPALRAAMMGETKELVRDFWQNDVPVAQLFSADFTYVNARLAQHYGLPAVTGDALQRVSVGGTTRGGLLAHGSFLTATSNPNRTSPVKRGFFVLDRLLCAAPPPPPGDVDLNIDTGTGFESLSVRERVAKHLEKGTSCFACHRIMDPIGLGLEHYDAVGSYRDADNFGPIDATGKLPSAAGELPFDGAKELATILASEERMLPCVVTKLMTYGLGRELRDLQLPYKEAVVSATQAGGGNFRAAMESLVQSDLFRMRRAAKPEEVKP